LKRVVKQLRHGQITIPKDLREEAGIEPGDLLSIDVVDGRLLLEPMRVTPKQNGSPWARELYEMFAPVRKKMQGRSQHEVNEAIDDALKKTRAARK
jgi:antitoxin MazE